MLFLINADCEKAKIIENPASFLTESSSHAILVTYYIHIAAYNFLSSNERSFTMSVYNLTFSPTGGTKRAADLFTRSFCPENICIDLTSHNENYSSYSFSEEDICIVSVPSYGGRVPSIAVSRLRQMNGGKAKAILLVVYGNRAYDDTFVELQDVLTDVGFRNRRPENSAPDVVFAPVNVLLRQ